MMCLGVKEGVRHYHCLTPICDPLSSADRRREWGLVSPETSAVS